MHFSFDTRAGQSVVTSVLLVNIDGVEYPSEYDLYLLMLQYFFTEIVILNLSNRDGIPSINWVRYKEVITIAHRIH